MKKTRRSTHPGTFLLEEVLKPRGISVNKLALAIGESEQYLNELTQRGVQIDYSVAVKLAQYFDTTITMWLKMQVNYNEGG